VLPLTQAATSLACAPKSNAVLAAYTGARKELKENGALPIPKKLLNATSGLAKALGSGKNYKYPHNFTGNYVAESYLPDDLEGARYYLPSDQGYEAVIKERLSKWRGESDDES
jgi:putative ATPase